MNMRALLIALPILLCSAPAVHAQVSVSIGLPGVNIGINVPVYPRLVLVPGYPVYYDPQASTNYFFYDGLYWVYQQDNWYASTWYNGPWELTAPEYVPLFVLRVPVRYYRLPPPYFHGWRADAAPRWGAHWGHEWEQRRRGWDRWNRRAVPAAAPLPKYQREFSGERYPRAIQQQESIRSEKYHYQPRETISRQHVEKRVKQGHDRAERPAQAPGQRYEQRQQMPEQPAARPHPRAAPPLQHNQSLPRGLAKKVEPQDGERDDKGDSHDKGRGNRNEERGQDRR